MLYLYIMNTPSATRTIRALTAYIGQKALKTALVLVVVIFLLLFIGVWALAQAISSWWLILLMPIFVAASLLFLVYSFLRFLLLKTYSHQFTKEQKIALRAFLKKITRLNNDRSTPMFVYVIKTAWEIVRFRDARTIRQTIEHSKTMKSDFEKLTTLF